MLKTLNIILLILNYGFGACMFVTAVPPVLLGLLSAGFGLLAAKLKEYRYERW
jgi:hypothetical protein